jgi:2-oxoglutarate dehydrogenase E1 component
MYKKIKEHPTTREIYAQQLVSEGVFTADQANNIVEEHLKF